jgi:predicted DNA-binding antitoxin AbrB/MazE fold protein
VIRAIYRDGIIFPAEPIPPEWSDGQEVRVEWGYDEPSDDPEEIDRWDAEWRSVGPFQYEPGERQRVQAILEEADTLAKACVRRHMESGQ